MSDFYSIDEVATRLGLHVRTVRNYVRSGRLRAIRIGKQYRVARADLDALTGRPASAMEDERNTPLRQMDVLSIVQIDATSPDAASRISNALMAAAKGRPDADDPLRIDTVYEQERARLKVVLRGSLLTTASLLRFINAYVEPDPGTVPARTSGAPSAVGRKRAPRKNRPPERM